MTQRHLDEIEAKLNSGLHPGEVHGCWIPTEAILKLPEDFVLVPDDTYCPVTFTDDVPDDLDMQTPVLESGGFIFVYGHCGHHAFYFKLK